MALLIIVTAFLAPAYALQFSLFGEPTNILMVWVIFLAAYFFVSIMVKKQLPHFWHFISNQKKIVLVAILLLFLAGIISLCIHGIDSKKLGQFIVLFLEPILVWLIAGYTFEKKPEDKQKFINSLYWLLGCMGAYAIVQYCTLWGLPSLYWGNSIEPKRAVSVFTHPNFYALFNAPLLAFLIPDLVKKFKIQNSKFKIYTSLLWVLGAAGLFLSLSRAGWIGLAAALAVYTIIAADKKTRLIIAAFIVIIIGVIIAIPNFRYRLITPFYGEKSALSRVSLWQAGKRAIVQSPITGLGLTGFSNEWSTLSADLNIPDTHNFPHNIFLDFWVEAGLLGLVSSMTLIFYTLYQGLKNKNNIILFSISLFLIAFLCQGQIDNPYFKNDLAIVFWLMLSLHTFNKDIPQN